ncbi:hypothetical protein NST08_07495 [Paenibacillus sp. FSL K6-1566]|uniref:hypothetical protein n=1 Tax=Paenibacillus sp. FSL K6-1566 TaxID=2954515 RepID=UPI0031013EC6
MERKNTAIKAVFRLSRNPLFFCRGFKIASSVTEVGFSERFKSIFILKDMIPHIKNRVSKSPLDFLDTLNTAIKAVLSLRPRRDAAFQADCEVSLPKRMLRRPPNWGSHPHGTQKHRH